MARWGDSLPRPSVAVHGAVAGGAVVPLVVRVPGQLVTDLTGRQATSTLVLPLDVTAGNLLIVSSSKFDFGSTAFTAAMLTQIAGTATLGPITMDSSHGIQGGFDTACWSAIVTGSGSLTVQIGGGDADYVSVATEYSATVAWGAGRVVDAAAPTNANDNTVTTAVMTSTSAAVFIGTCAILNAASHALVPSAPATNLVVNDTDPAFVFAATAEDIRAAGVATAVQWPIAPAESWIASGATYQPGVP